jgi:hypothetical protein
MTDLIFNQRHVVYGCANKQEVHSRWLDRNIDVVVVDSLAKGKWLEDIMFQGQIKIMGQITADPPQGVDSKIVKGLQRIIRWFSDYGLTKLHLGVAGLLVRGCLEVLSRWYHRHYLFVQIYTQRAGHLAYNTATLITAKRRDKTNIRFIPVLVGGNHADPYLLDLFCRLLGNKPRTRWHRLLRTPIIRKSMFYADSWQYTDALEPIQRYGSEYDVDLMDYATEEEKATAFRELLVGHTIAMPTHGKPYRPYMLFHVRDSAYLDEHQPGYDWRYHEFRDSELTNCLLAADHMTNECDVQAIRIGVTTNQTIHKDYIKKGIIDYAQNPQRPLLDLHLIANAKFLLGSNCGVTQVAQVLKVPVAVANWAQLELLCT